MRRKRDRIAIWGAGGHASVVADMVRLGGRYSLAVFVDDIHRSSGRELFEGVPIIRTRRALVELRRSGVRDMVVAVGDCVARLRLAAEAMDLGFRLVTVVHPRAVVASSVTLGAGSVIAAGAVVNPGVTLGENVIINTAATVDHDCVVEEGAHICPGVHLAGWVRVGRGAWVGIGGCVVDRVKIGSGAYVGAGAVVVRDIPARTLAYGVPARLIRKLPGGTPSTVDRSWKRKGQLVSASLPE